LHCNNLSHRCCIALSKTPREWVLGDPKPYREDVELMNTMRKVGLALVTAVLGVGLLGVSAPAHAYVDTNWPCAGCAKAPHHP